jgi:hypothetical protein
MPSKRLAAAFGLGGDGWLRHANPASVWTRFTVVPLLAASVWSREWIGWVALVPVALSIIWLFVNPLFFPRPASTRNWASKCVFGERIWVDRRNVTLPAEFRSSVPTAASMIQAIGLLPLVYGLVTFDVIAVVCGVLLVQTAKLWYLDRMTLLFDAMAARNPEYESWMY